MDIELTEADVAFRDGLRAFLEANRDAFDDEHEWHRRLVEGRWVVPSWPQRWGGRDATLTQEIVYNQLMGEFDAPVPRNSIGLFNIGPMLLTFGTPEQQQRYLPPMVRADEIWCQGFSEPAAGSDLAALETRAEDRGDHWTVRGRKVWTTFADEADLCLALVRTDPSTAPGADQPGAPKHRGISAVIVDMRADGVEVRPIREITGDDGFNEIAFDDVIVPKDALVGDLHAGWRIAMSTLQFERLGTMKLGVQLRRRLDELIDLARRLGHDTDPVVRQELARLGVEVDLMQLLTEQALAAMARGEDPGAALPLGKLQWSELMQELAEAALDLEGPHGGLYRDPPHELAGDWAYHCLYSRMTTIGAGTTQVQKNILAYRILGLPRDADTPPSPGTITRDRSIDEVTDELRSTVRRFLADRHDEEWVREMLDDPRGTTDAVWKSMAELGLQAILVPEDHGGLGLGYVTLGVVLEELGRALHPGPFASSALAAVTTVLDVGGPRDHTDLLPSLADGSVVGTLALLEPDRGYGWRSPMTTATRDGDGWTITGRKLFVPDAVAADLLLVVAADDDGLGVFAVRSTDPGVAVSQLGTLDATKKQGEVVLGGAPARRLGEGDATRTLAGAIDRIVAGLVAEAVGAAHRALVTANEYAKVRIQFGQLIGSFQAIQHLLADMLRDVELTRAGAISALRAADRGDSAACHRSAVVAAAHGTDALERATAGAIQVHGGIGFTWEHDAHLSYKRALGLRHVLGGGREFRDDYAALLLDAR